MKNQGGRTGNGGMQGGRNYIGGVQGGRPTIGGMAEVGGVPAGGQPVVDGGKDYVDGGTQES